MEFLRDRDDKKVDILPVFPFSASSIKSIAALIGDIQSPQNVISALKSSLCQYDMAHNYGRLVISLIGHRHQDKILNKDYFGAIVEDRLPTLLRDIMHVVVATEPLKNIPDITFRMYVCNAQGKIAEMESELKTSLQEFNDKNITIKASVHEIIANPVYKILF